MAPPQARFRAVLELHGKTATGIEVPASAVEALGAGKRPAVVVALGAHEYPSTVAPRGDRYLVPVSAEHRTAAGVAAGDEIDVTLTLDASPRTVEIPQDLADALAAVPGATERFAALSPSHRREHVRSVVEAKKADTRARRVGKVLDALR